MNFKKKGFWKLVCVHECACGMFRPPYFQKRKRIEQPKFMYSIRYISKKMFSKFGEIWKSPSGMCRAGSEYFKKIFKNFHQARLINLLLNVFLTVLVFYYIKIDRSSD